ncbi:hypothetical protein CANINC_002029 [Pichia inconspicua]|uniref:Uncharacterized protein n=1 Tax=Pichia inconspicua TaxID=52247 RepID=A0A4T0X272_9ASCO|nr:hypothetical protein CANINC_002029 [[Candida] inconspicua]
MVLNATEEINQIRNNEINLFEDGLGVTLEDDNVDDFYSVKEPTKLEKDFIKFTEHKRDHLILKTTEDFPAWFKQLERYLAFLGLNNAASKLIDERVKNHSKRLKDEQESVIKDLISLTVDPNKFDVNQGLTAQEDLFNIIYKLGYVKNGEQIIEMLNNFKIDVRDSVEVSLKKWNILRLTHNFSKFNIDHKIILSHISKNFPKDATYQPLALIIGKHLNSDKAINLVDVIKEIHDKIRELCSVSSVDVMFNIPKDVNTNNNIQSSRASNEEIRIQNIMKNNSKRSRRRYNRNRINKNTQKKPSKHQLKSPTSCKFCGKDHPSEECPNDKPGICRWCGKEGHMKKQCLSRRLEEAQKKVNAVTSDNISTSLMLNTIRRNDDMVSRVNSRESDDICNGIVLDTGAQASVTGSVDNLHSYFPVSASDQDNIKSVTNTPIKILGYGLLRLRLDFTHPMVIDIPVYHCSNINGTFLSDDDLTDFGVDYRSINGVPYLCWKDEKIRLIKGDKLVYIPPSMFSFEDKKIAGIHEALGHVDRDVAEKSVAKGFVQVDKSELDDSRKEKCITCQIGKARRCDHKAGSRDKYIISIPLRVFHADLMYINVNDNDKEPIGDVSFSMFKWVLALTDDYSKTCFAFPLRRKSEFILHFIRLCNYIKTTFNTSIAVLHTDQGSEFVNKTARNIYDAFGITHVVTNGYSSMENGVAERRNLTIKNDIRTNLVSSKLDYSLWPIVMEYVVSIRNKTAAKNQKLSPEGMIISHYLPTSDILELYPHKFKSFGRHGIWYDVASKQPSLMKTGIHCFYLGPSQYPCASDSRVLNGDKILAFIPQANGYFKPVIKQTTNVSYSMPVKLLKDINLIDFGIKIQPVDTTYNQPQQTKVVDTRNDNQGNSENMVNTDSQNISNNLTNPNINQNATSNEDGINISENIGNVDSNVNLRRSDNNQLNVTNDVQMVDVPISAASKGGTHNVDPTIRDSEVHDVEMNDVAMENIAENKDVDNEPENNDATGTITAEESKLGEEDNSVEEIEEVSAEDVDKLKSFERVVKEGNVNDIIEANKENLVEVAVDKELKDHFNPKDTVTLPEGRLLRSRFKFKTVNSVKLVPDFSKRTGELPNPKRIIYQIVSKDPKEGHEWVDAFNKELNSHKQNSSWDFEPIITSDPEILKRTVKLDVICTEKRAAIGERPKKKVRFVLRGDKQDSSTYSNTYSPTLPYDLLRIILAECVQSRRYSVFLDISTAYLNAEIDHDIYVELPAVLEKDKPKVRLGEKVVHKVKRAIYGLKQSGRLWYERLTNFLISIGFERRGDIPCVLIKPMRGNPNKISIIVGFFVDDMVVTGNSKFEVDRFVDTLSREFNLRITNPDNNGYRDILGINVKENRDKRSGTLLSMDLSMNNYIKKMIIKLGYEKEFKKSRKISTPMTPNFQFDKQTESSLIIDGDQLAQEIHWFREVVGCLQYLATALRPDIAYAANYMARFCMYPHPKLKAELIRILRYTYQTRDYKIRYTRFTSDIEKLNESLITYSDADYAGDVMTRKSTLASIFMMNGGPVAWFARVAKFAATSSTDAEVAAMVESGNGVAYYREILSFLKVIGSAYSRKREYDSYNSSSGGVLADDAKLNPLIIFVDNVSAIYLAQKGVTGSRTKHMGVRVARANEIMEKEHITYKHLGTKEMLADILTKPVTAEVMNTLIPMILTTESPKVKNI